MGLDAGVSVTAARQEKRGWQRSPMVLSSAGAVKFQYLMWIWTKLPGLACFVKFQPSAHMS